MSGTTNILHIYSQNVWKNYVLVDSLLESQKDLYDILFTQVLWQPLITKINDHTNNKSLSWISSGEFTRELDKESLLN